MSIKRLSRAQLDDREEDEQGDADKGKDDDPGVIQVTSAGFGQGVKQDRQARSGEEESRHVQAARRCLLLLAQEEPRDNQGDDTDGDVGEEYPVPGLIFHQVAAENRAGRRRNRCRYRDDGAGLGTLRGGERPEHHRHAHGCEHPAADPLQHAGGNQGVDVPG